jgi:hypothetical protein
MLMEESRLRLREQQVLINIVKLLFVAGPASGTFTANPAATKIAYLLIGGGGIGHWRHHLGALEEKQFGKQLLHNLFLHPTYSRCWRCNFSRREIALPGNSINF